MKKILILVLLAITFVAINAEVIYLSEEEYKDLSKQERIAYNEELLNEIDDLLNRKALAIENNEKYQKEIEVLKEELATLNSEYAEVRTRILEKLNLTEEDMAIIRDKIDYYNSQLAQWNNLSDDELWKAKTKIKELITDYQGYRDSNYGKAPDFIKEFTDLDRKFSKLENTLNSARPKYYEDEYTVKAGDYLSKISGYSFIYNDPSKWGIIYRANRDKVSDPNNLVENMVLKIPRGKPYQWKVYKGECLWRIASYPEVYGSGTKWPLIYRANKDKIKDPDLIYPNQVFEIPRD